jgi:hypothetical protein
VKNKIHSQEPKRSPFSFFALFFINGASVFGSFLWQCQKEYLEYFFSYFIFPKQKKEGKNCFFQFYKMIILFNQMVEKNKNCINFDRVIKKNDGNRIKKKLSQSYR